MKKPNTSIVAVMRYATFALALAGTLSVFADRKWTAGGGNDTDWTNDANWDSGTGTRLFNQQNWTATDNTINVSFTNRTTESGNAFFIQSKTDTVVFNAASDEAGLDITVPNSGNWWVQNFYVGTDAQDGAWVVNGGTYSIGGGSLYIGHNGNNKAATGEVTVNGATLNLYEDLLVGSGGTGTLTITNGGTVVCQSSSAGGKWVKLGDNGSSGANIINLEEGGTLMIWHIEQTSANSSSTVNFNGGTLTAIGKDSNNCRYLLGNTDSGHTVSPIVNILSKGGTIESVAGVDAVVTTPLVTGVSDGVDGGLIKAGAGGLTLAAVANTYTGPTVVKGGSLVLPDGGTLASTKLVLDGGTFAGKTFDDVEIASGNYTFSTLPVSATGTITLEGGTLCMTVAEAQATADTAKVVVDGGTLLIDGSTAESVSVGSSFTFANVTLGDNVEVADVVKVSGVNFDWTYGSSDGHPTAMAGTASGENVWVGGATGNWSDAANWSYGVPTSSQTVVFDTDAVVSLSTSGTSHYYVSNIVANATIQFKSTNTSSVHPSINFKEATGDGTIQLYHAGLIVSALPGTISEKTTIEILYVSATSDSWLEGNSAAVPLKVYGSITGAGYLINRKQTYFYGDNSGHTGAVLCEHKIGVSDAKHFGPGNTGFPNSSSLEIQSGIYLEGNADDVYNFGGLKMATFNANNYDFHIYVPNGFTGTMKVGCGNQDVEILNKHKTAFRVTGQNNNDGVADAVLEKVGTGTLTTRILGAYTLKVTEGAAVIGADNPSLAVEVASGAVLMGGATIASVSFESGAIIRQAIAASGGTYTCPTLTITGNVNVTGLVCDLVDANSFLENAQATDENLPTFTLLSATSVTGKPTGSVAMATEGWAWLPKVKSGTQVVMSAAATNPGFIIIIR